MPHLHISDPAWQTTFPFLVAPMQDEWLTGLLLRCDEANHWGSGTTLIHLCRRNEKTANSDWTFIAPSGFPFDDLADALAVSREALVATTYQAELARIYGVADPHALLLQTSFSFRLCPVCVAEQRLLTRTLVLPHITICPRHHIMLALPAFVGQRYDLFRNKLRHFDASSVAWIGQNCPRKRLTRHVSRSKHKCSRTISFSGRMGHQKS